MVGLTSRSGARRRLASAAATSTAYMLSGELSNPVRTGSRGVLIGATSTSIVRFQPAERRCCPVGTKVRRSGAEMPETGYRPVRGMGRAALAAQPAAADGPGMAGSTAAAMTDRTFDAVVLDWEGTGGWDERQ